MASPSLEQFTEDARTWLDDHATLRPVASGSDESTWAEGEFSVSVFDALTFDEERERRSPAARWTRTCRGVMRR